MVLHGDGGGNAPAIAHSNQRPRQVERTLIAGLRNAGHGGFTLRREEVNGQPGALFFDPEGEVAAAMILDVDGGPIQAVSSIVNPDKLRHLGPVADLRTRCSASGDRYFSSRAQAGLRPRRTEQRPRPDCDRDCRPALSLSIVIAAEVEIASPRPGPR